MTIELSGMACWILATMARTSSFDTPGKFDSVSVIGEKFTRRSPTATEVSASIFTVPRLGLSAPFAVYETAA